MGVFDDLQDTKKDGIAAGGRRSSVGMPVDAVGDGGGASGSSGGVSSIKRKRKHTSKKSAGKGRKRGGGGSSAGIVSAASGSDIVGVAAVDPSLLPSSVSDVLRVLPSLVGIWCDNNGVSDVRKVSPLVFRSLCGFIGGYIKESKILKDTTKRSGGGWGRGASCNAYNVVAVSGLWDIFVGFCCTCDKIPFASAFAGFSGVSLSYVREYTQGLTSQGLDLAKKTHDAEMDSIRQKTAYNPVGGLAILNNEYYGGGAATGSDAGKVVASLPPSSSFGLIGGEKID